MNTIVDPTGTTWRHIKFQYVSLACGLALAASAAVYLNGDLSSGGELKRGAPAAPRPVLAARAVSYVQAQTPKTTYFLVNTQEQADKAFQIMDQSGLHGDGLLPPYEIVLGRTPAEKRNQLALLDAASAAWGDSAARVIDLRDR